MNKEKILKLREQVKLKYPFKEEQHNAIWQHFGKNPETYKRFGLAGHNGLDFVVPEGTPIKAICDGEAVGVKNTKHGYGLYVRQFTELILLDNEKVKLDIVYGHNEKNLVKVGDKIKAGQTIALAGNTGFSSGSHLHLGIRLVSGYNNKILEYNNGYFGYFDFYPLFEHPNTYSNYFYWKKSNFEIPDWEILPVDKRYGFERTWKTYLKEKAIAFNPWLIEKIKRLPTNQEINGLVYGYHTFENIFKDKIDIWWKYYHYPEYKRRLEKKLGL